MTNRIVATIFIFTCSTIAWAILGSTIFVRTNTASAALNGHVESIWGSAQVQSPPMRRTSSAMGTLRGEPLMGGWSAA